MNEQQRPCKGRIVTTVGVGIVAALSIGAAVLQAQTEWFKNHDTTGRVHLGLVYAVMVLLPLAFLLFAFGVQWAMRRRRLLAALALVALPIWGHVLYRYDGLLSTDMYFGFVFAQLNGIQPFGAR